MPIYEYSCRKCGHEFEVLIRKESDLPGKCVKCGAPMPVKGLSAFAVSAKDPTSGCETCPSASSSLAGGQCASGKCPFSS